MDHHSSSGVDLAVAAEWRTHALRQLDAYVRIPTVSHQFGRDEIDRVLEFWTNLGFSLKELSGGGPGSPPALWGEITAGKNAPTLLIYGHYDVEPPGIEADWNWLDVKCEPFLPTYFCGERQVSLDALSGEDLLRTVMVARGCVDNKGQHFALIFAALEAERAGRLAWNVRVLLDGEEENGSPDLERIVRQNGPLLKADLCLCADAPKFQNRPTLVLGVRGSLGVRLRCSNGRVGGVHSGNYGNLVRNPTIPLASLIDEIDRGVSALAEGRPAFRVEMERLSSWWHGETWRRYLWPTVNVHHFATEGTSSQEHRLIIPNAASAHIDVRLTPDTPLESVVDIVSELVEEHNKSPKNENVTFEVEFYGGKPASASSPGSVAARWITQLLSEWAGEPPIIFPILGGTLPTWVFKEICHIPTYIIPCANSDNQQHDVNEHYVLSHFVSQVELARKIMTAPPYDLKMNED